MRIRGFDFFGSLSTCFTIYLVKLKQYEGLSAREIGPFAVVELVLANVLWLMAQFKLGFKEWIKQMVLFGEYIGRATV